VGPGRQRGPWVELIMMLFRAAESAQRSTYPCAILTRSRRDFESDGDSESGAGTVTVTQAARPSNSE
jgi:hypothetical protein